MTPRAFLMQPTLSLFCRDSTLWDAAGIPQPEPRWVCTEGMRNLLLEGHVFFQAGEARLQVEGTDDPSGDWAPVHPFVNYDVEPVVIRLSHKRSRDARIGRLWRLIRWRWVPGPAGLYYSAICFRIKAVMKP